MGWNSVVLTSSVHHLLDQPRAPGVCIIEGVAYDFLRTPPYKGNGLRRVINMLAFCSELLKQKEALVAKHGRPAMVIASSPHPYCYLAAQRIAKKFQSRCVFEVRDLWPLSLVELGGVSASHPLVYLTDWLERRAYKSADAVVSLLPKTLEHMRARGLTKERWHYIPNGVDIGQDFQGDVESGLANLAINLHGKGRVVVVYAGALGRPNHLSSLINAMTLQKTQGTNVSVIIVGRGEQSVELRGLIDRLDLSDLIHMFEQVPKRAVLGLLREAHIGFISLRPEPLFRFGISPNKIFDYMLAGLPIISAIEAGNDPVQEAGCGYSVNPDRPEEISEALTRLATMTADHRREMGLRGRNWVELNHSYAHLARKYIKLIGPSAR